MRNINHVKNKVKINIKINCVFTNYTDKYINI